MRSLLSGVTHIALDGFVPSFGLPGLGSIASDVRRLGRHGYRLALVGHGSDVRDPDRHADRFEFSYFHAAPDEYVDVMRRISRRNREIAEQSGLQVFVSTPDLLLDLPFARWVPVAVDAPRWVATDRPFRGGLPRVLHVPSKRRPPIKGTDVIDPVLRSLADRGRIEYVAPERVSHAEMPALVASCDVVIDQIRSGSYGVATVEALAAGRVVVGNVATEVRALISDELPVVDASPTRFAGVLDAILDDPSHALELAGRGPGFVSTWHDGEASANALRDFLEH